VAVAALASTSIHTLDDAEFRFLSDFVARHCGISMGEHKRQLLQGRLQRRLRALGLGSFEDYCRLLREDPQSELDEFASAVSTNVTAFFREPHHFDFLSEALPAWLAQNPGGRVRIWSAGCSTGEEPYSLAMLLAEALEKHHGSADALILATDLSPAALDAARSGVYPSQRLDGISPERRRRWLQRGSGTQAGKVRVHPRLKELVRICPLNLLEPWPMHGKFDAILCRNVMIYFDAPTKRQLFERFDAALQPHGRLFLGHSESMHGLSDRFTLIGRTIYERRF
jgi:chemotaxis protein methyltransferase CheR